jgi:hypothetical protein
VCLVTILVKHAMVIQAIAQVANLAKGIFKITMKLKFAFNNALLEHFQTMEYVKFVILIVKLA